jgi:fructokinase
LGTDVTTVHFGSLSLIDEPAAGHFAELMTREKGRRILTLDPNIRPSVVRGNEAASRARLAAMLGLADVIKISAADLAWLDPDLEPAVAAAAWLRAGTSLVVLTAGGAGATAFVRDGRAITRPAQPIQVVDTVGAGDSFMGALLAGLELGGAVTSDDLVRLDDAAVADVLAFAIQVSGITCSRAGADPPWRNEVTLPGGSATTRS